MRRVLKWLGVSPARIATPTVATLVFAVLAGCSSGLDQKFDASSEKAFKQSLQRIESAAKPDERERLNEALRVLAVTDMSIGFEGGILGALDKLQSLPIENLAEPLLPLVNGKSGREVIVAATERKLTQAGKQMKALEAEQKKLARAKQEYLAGKPALAAIEVAEAKLYHPGGRMAMLDFKVTNQSEHVLTRIYLRGTVMEGEPPKALFSDDINYKLPAGLLPGDSKEIKLPYTQTDRWNAPALAQKANLALALEVVNAEDPTGKKLTTPFSDKDAARLAELAQQMPRLERMLRTELP